VNPNTQGITKQGNCQNHDIKPLTVHVNYRKKLTIKIQQQNNALLEYQAKQKKNNTTVFLDCLTL
jgi:hypothetical protein